VDNLLLPFEPAPDQAPSRTGAKRSRAAKQSQISDKFRSDPSGTHMVWPLRSTAGNPRQRYERSEPSSPA